MSVSPSDALTIMAGVAAIGTMVGYLVGLLTARACYCGKCGYHVNERRMRAERQREVDHEYAHKGAGFTDKSPDLWDCSDRACKRNSGENGRL